MRLQQISGPDFRTSCSRGSAFFAGESKCLQDLRRGSEQEAFGVSRGALGTCSGLWSPEPHRSISQCGGLHVGLCHKTVLPDAVCCVHACSCDGEGRVVGGVGALPGMAWWPVKAYRPCPALSQAGMEYVRCVMQHHGSAACRILTGSHCIQLCSIAACGGITTLLMLLDSKAPSGLCLIICAPLNA